MQRADYIKAFNQTIQEFTVQLEHLFPQDPFLARNRNNLQMLVRMSAAQPSKRFYDHLHPLTEDIKNKNIDRFRKLMQESQDANNTDVYALLQYMNVIWDNPKMTAESKENVWKYMILMSALSNKIHDKA